jgi:hypothetical protein
MLNYIFLLFLTIGLLSFIFSKSSRDKGRYAINKYEKLLQFNFVKSHVLGNTGRNNLIQMFVINNSDEIDIPAVRIVANIHGNETTGVRLWYKVALYICKSYQKYLDGEINDKNKKIARLVENLNICIIPSMNPDNIFKWRGNKNWKDLNRDFHLDNNYNYQKETKLIIESTNMFNFVLDMECHDGAHVLCFPYDYITKKKTPDNSTFEYICDEYIKLNKNLINNPNPRKFKKGYIMGSHWYPANGTLRDYMYIKHNLLGLTIEYSSKKNPSDKKVEEIYKQNKLSSLRFLELALDSCQFVVKDQNENPIDNVKLIINETCNAYYSNKTGYLNFLVKPGEYNIQIIKENYQILNKKITVPCKINNIILRENIVRPQK